MFYRWNAIEFHEALYRIFREVCYQYSWSMTIFNIASLSYVRTFEFLSTVGFFREKIFRTLPKWTRLLKCLLSSTRWIEPGFPKFVLLLHGASCTYALLHECQDTLYFSYKRGESENLYNPRQFEGMKQRRGYFSRIFGNRATRPIGENIVSTNGIYNRLSKNIFSNAGKQEALLESVFKNQSTRNIIILHRNIIVEFFKC